MPDTIRLDNVPGSRIVFRNFRGKPTPVTKEGDRSFCLILSDGPDYKSHLIREQLAARGCNIKKLKDGTEFVNVAVRIIPKENVDDIWTMLDVDKIENASLEFTFHDYDDINGRKGARIYLKAARFLISETFIGQFTIDIHWPNTISVANSTNNTNNTEETNMEKIMSVEEIFTQFALLEFAYKNANSTDKKNLEDIMKAVRSAKYHLKPKMEDTPAPETDNKSEEAADFASIKQVIFNRPATIVVWFDDVKTVVKCQKGDTFDKEKGLAMAICKRLYGNESNFNNLIKKWTEPNVKKAVKKAIKKAEGKSKNFRGKDIVPRKRRAPAIVNTDKMVVLSDAYADLVRKRMAKRGWSYYDTAKAAGLGNSTINRYFSPNTKCQKPKRMKIDNFKKINKALGIIWKIEEAKNG